MKTEQQTLRTASSLQKAPHLGDMNADCLRKRLEFFKQQNQELWDLIVKLERQQLPVTGGGAKNRDLQLAELIIDSSPAILFRRLASEDPQKRKMVYVSPNISHFGYQADDFISGRTMYRELLYPDDHERILREISNYVENNIDTYTQVYRIVTRDGEIRWVEDRTSVIEDEHTGIRYHQGIVIDIHRRKEAEEKVRKSEEKYRRIVETAGEGFLLMDQEYNIVDLNTAFVNMVRYPRSELIGKKPDDLFSNGHQKSWSMENKRDPRSEYWKFECEITGKDGIRVPALVHANTLRSDNDIIIGYMAFITDMTEHKKALALAGEVQRSLLPEKAPDIGGLDIAGKNIPCDEVGGDYYDFLTDRPGDSDLLTVVVGDITGHGVDSALLMSSARAFLRMRASQPGTLTDILTEMNGHLTDDVYATGRFMTLFCLSFNNRPERSIKWIRAGHDPALLYDPLSDRFEELKGPGMALGVDRNHCFEEQEKGGLGYGSIIVIGTDGIWERRNKMDEMFGKDRLMKIVRQKASCQAEIILNAILQEQALFAEDVQAEDDITIVVIKVGEQLDYAI